MGKKVNPKIFRIGINRTWPSVWFATGKDYIKNNKQDVLVRRFLMNDLKEAGIDNVRIERGLNKITLDITAGKPGVIIGHGGNGIEDLKKKIHAKFLKNFRMKEINLNIKECDRPNLSSQIIMQAVIADIEKRMPFKRTMKQAIGRVEKAGGLGVKIMVAGRLNGAEIAREEKLVSGKIPLQTLRADIDYSRGAAHTTYGTIGVKVWIYKGEVFEKDLKNKDGKGEILGRRK
jgi:ribosomal protein S3, bacterial type